VASAAEPWEVAHGWDGQELKLERVDNQAEAEAFADELFRDRYSPSSNWTISAYRMGGRPWLASVPGNSPRVAHLIRSRGGSLAGGLKTRTYSDKDYGPGEARDKALELKAFLDANGTTYKLATKAKVRKDSTKPMVSEVVIRHIDLLRKPQPGTIAKYRKMAAAHIDSSDLGKTPVDKVIKAAVIDWLDGLTVSKGASQTVDAPLSRKTKQNIHALLSAAFVTAMECRDHDPQPRQGCGRG
jgi:hypothetical protein